MSSIYTFLFINFVVSFISDIVLNDLSKSTNLYFSSLAPYFRNKSIIEAGVYAGITIVIALLFQMLISNMVMSFYVPKTGIELSKYCILAYILGYIVDIVIEKFSIFGSTLEAFYRIVGSGHSGAIAFVFSIIISYLLQNNLLPIL